ncbi:MAG: hypothetical protein K0S07_351 [Chlamydiales bacterium]|nr:hypothetical protein [Chlamydiales bacterium]
MGDGLQNGLQKGASWFFCQLAPFICPLFFSKGLFNKDLFSKDLFSKDLPLLAADLFELLIDPMQIGRLAAHIFPELFEQFDEIIGEAI